MEIGDILHGNITIVNQFMCRDQLYIENTRRLLSFLCMHNLVYTNIKAVSTKEELTKEEGVEKKTILLCVCIGVHAH